MIWYRHWLEIRRGLVVLVGALVLFSFSADFSAETDLRESDPVGRYLLAAQAARAMTRGELLAWGSYAEQVWIHFVLAGLLTAGLGYGSTTQWGGRSVLYTLALPISRVWLIGTRLAASFFAAVVSMAFGLGLYIVTLAWQELSIPWTELLQSFLSGIPLAVTWVALVGAVLTVTQRWWSFVIGALLLVVVWALPAQMFVVQYVAYGHVPWLWLTLTVALAGAAISFTLYRAPRREF